MKTLEMKTLFLVFQSPSGVGVVQTLPTITDKPGNNEFQSPSGVGVVQTNELGTPIPQNRVSFNHLAV